MRVTPCIPIPGAPNHRKVPRKLIRSTALKKIEHVRYGLSVSAVDPEWVFQCRGTIPAEGSYA